MKKVLCFVFSMCFIPLISHVEAKSLDVNEIIKKSEAALEASRSGTRKMEIILRNGEQITRKWGARRAHKVFPDGKRDLMVILSPDDLRGTAYEYWVPKNEPVVQWIYSTAVGRVRKLMDSDAYGSFFATDFTYADLDITHPAGKYKLLGEEKFNNQTVYKVEDIPQKNWYYSRIVSLIASDTFLPLKRDYYDAAGRLWKTKLFENITAINDISIPLKIRMMDLQRNGSTEFVFSEICYDVDFLKEEDFDPKKLPEAPLSPVCRVKMSK